MDKMDKEKVLEAASKMTTGDQIKFLTGREGESLFPEFLAICQHYDTMAVEAVGAGFLLGACYASLHLLGKLKENKAETFAAMPTSDLVN